MFQTGISFVELSMAKWHFNIGLGDPGSEGTLRHNEEGSPAERTPNRARDKKRMTMPKLPKCSPKRELKSSKEK